MSREKILIGTLAERTGVPADTIRYWEDEGVLPEPDRSEAGYRLYGEGAVERLRFIRQAQALGLQLDDIAEVLALVEERGIEPCAHVEAKLRERLSEVWERIRQLEGLRQRLQEALERAETAPGNEDCRCRIIEGGDEEGRVELDPPGFPGRLT
jgi:DNA-binding transcriptional MerR regulator